MRIHILFVFFILQVLISMAVGFITVKAVPKKWLFIVKPTLEIIATISTITVVALSYFVYTETQSEAFFCSSFYKYLFVLLTIINSCLFTLYKCKKNHHLTLAIYIISLILGSIYFTVILLATAFCDFTLPL